MGFRGGSPTLQGLAREVVESEQTSFYEVRACPGALTAPAIGLNQMANAHHHVFRGLTPLLQELPHEASALVCLEHYCRSHQPFQRLAYCQVRAGRRRRHTAAVARTTRLRVSSGRMAAHPGWWLLVAQLLNRLLAGA
jgi:hypothetical protein